MLTLCKPVIESSRASLHRRCRTKRGQTVVKQWSNSSQTVVKQWLNQALARLMLASGTRGAGGAGGVPVQGNGGNSVATSYKLQQK